MQIHHHDIGGAVDQVDHARHSVVSSAGGLVEGADPQLVATLGEGLVVMARLLVAFHHVFDCPIDPRSLSEDERELQDWAAGYDRGYADSLAIYRKHAEHLPQN